MTIDSYEAYVSWIHSQEYDQEMLEQCRATEEAAAILMGNKPIPEVCPDTEIDIPVFVDWDDG
jgi:hypothetical protein